MDSNERNNSVSVPGSNEKDVKIKPVGKCENSVAVKVKTDTRSNSIIENKLEDIRKRKIAERFEVNMDNEDSNDSVKRMRYSDGKNDALSTNNNEGAKEVYTLLLTNSPGEWTSEEVLNFVKDECGVHISSINDSRGENTHDDFQIRLRFETKKQLDQVLVKLKEKEEQGKLTVNLIHNVKDELVSDAESDEKDAVLEQIESKEVKEATVSLKTNEVVDSEQSNDFYMREEYLQSLGIKPPITSWVYVTNFRCDKSELKEVLGLAGKVLICSVSMAIKYANVMYSHPLEAVQAVSMLNGQKYYGQTLKVEMIDITEKKALLPKGLAGVGPGLGKYGKPILDLPNQFKKFIKGKPSIMDACLFQPSFLKTIGISIQEDIYKFVRDVPSCNSHSSQNETDRQTNESPNEKGSDQKEQSSYGPIGKKLGNKIPVLMPQIDKTVNISPRPSMAGPTPIPNPMPGPMQGPMPIPNPMPGSMQGSMPMSNQMAGPMQSPVRVPNPMPPMPIPNSMPGPIQGPVLRPNQGPMPVPNPMPGQMKGPLHSPVMVPRGPGPTSMGPTQRPGFPMGNQSPIYPNVPPIPGVEPLNDSRNVNGIMPGPRLPGPRGPMPGPINPMLGPRGPMPGPTRFPGPGPMLGPAGPMVPNGPLRPNMYFGPNVRMFKGPDPLLVQMTNLPPTTNFVTLGQKLSELGHVLFLELTTPGCANVRFASPADVDRCLQNYRQVMG